MVALLVTVPQACGVVVPSSEQSLSLWFLHMFSVQNSGCVHCIIRNNHLAESHVHGV